MPGQSRILILTSLTGGGHLSLAEALRDLLRAAGVGATVTIADPQPPLIGYHYRLVSRHALGIWSAEYALLDTPRRARLAQRAFARLTRRSLLAALDQAAPDLVISTYPFFGYGLVEALRLRGASAPVALLLSDPARVHATWLAERRAALTLAPTRETYQQALAAGFAPARLLRSGWPVRAQFLAAAALTPDAAQSSRARTLAALGLDPGRFTVFLQGGGEGAARVGRAVASIRAAGGEGGAQVILAAGSNRELLARYRGAVGVATLPFTTHIAPHMAAADVVMGKAGPNMLFEAVTLGKPFIATTYIPGQESPNLAFIERHSLGWVALTEPRRRALLARIMRSDGEDAGTLAAMRARVEAYRAWNQEAVAGIAPALGALLAARAVARSGAPGEEG
jgi:UDP-N-acetylglucosamine:LPS N-acetylglucosamine transferase